MARKDSNWTFSNILRFIQFQNSRVVRKEISGATVRNYVKSIKLFCDMADLPVAWKKITRGLPRGRQYADDRIPTIEELTKLLEYPDRRIKAIVYTMASSGIRLGAVLQLEVWLKSKTFQRHRSSESFLCQTKTLFKTTRPLQPWARGALCLLRNPPSFLDLLFSNHKKLERVMVHSSQMGYACLTYHSIPI
jgi:hypothetical protein